MYVYFVIKEVVSILLSTKIIWSKRDNICNTRCGDIQLASIEFRDEIALKLHGRWTLKKKHVALVMSITLEWAD